MLRTLTFRAAPLCAVFAAFSSVNAQILLKPAGGFMEPLHQKSLEADVKVNGQFATTKMTHIFLNPTRQRIEAEFIYTLPEGATVTSFAYWYGEEKVVAYVAEKERARQIYKSITERQRDPALVELIGKRTFHAKIFPVMPLQDLRVEVTWVTAIPSIKGVPTISLPIRMKEKEDRLESLKAHVEIAREPWMQSAVNNQGIAMSEDPSTFTFDWSAEKIRPTQDLRIGLKPKTGEVVASLFAARSGGQDGYFVFNAISANKPDFKVPGVRFSNIHQYKMGTNTVVTGKYRGTGSGSVSLGGRTTPVTFTDQAISQNLAVKKWAADEIESMTRRGASAKSIISMSMTHSMPSKYTAWIAIPNEERKLHEKLIKQAKVRSLASTFVKTVFQNGGPTARTNEMLRQLKPMAEKVELDAKSLVSQTANEIMWQRVEKIGNMLAQKKLSSSERRSIRNEVSRLKAVSKGLDLDFSEEYVSYIGSSVYENAEKIAEYELMGQPNSPDIKKDRIAVNNFCEIVGVRIESVIEEHYNQAVNNQVSSLLNDVYTGKVNEAEIASRSEKITSFAKRRKFNLYGFHGNRDYEVGSILVQEKLGWPVDKNKLEAAHRWLKVAEDMKVLQAKPYVDMYTAQFLVNDSYTAQNEFDSEVYRGNFNSEKALKALDRIVSNIAISPETQRSQFANVLRSISYRIGESTARQAFEAKDHEVGKRKLAEGQELLEKKFGKYKLFDKKELHGAYESGILSSVQGLAYRVHEQENSLQQSKKSIKATRDELEAMAKWANVDAKKIYNETNYYSDTEWKVRHELLLLYINGSKDTAKVRQLENELKALTPRKNDHYQQDRVDRIRANGQANSVMDQIEALQDESKKPALQAEYEKYMNKAKTIAARMGDPLLSVDLPETTSNVTATFPWGETRNLVWNEKTKRFECRFDIPPTAKEGIQDVVIKGTGMLGNELLATSPVHVDVTPPKFAVEVKEGRVEVTDQSGDIARVRIFVNGGEPVDLVRGSNASWWANTTVHTQDQVRVIATDKAHNRAEFPVVPILGRPSMEKVYFGDAKVDLSGHNIQSLGRLGELVFAGTLDEGLWVRGKDGAWSEMKGIPTQCPRSMVEFGGNLIVRYGDGNLIQIAPDLTWKQLNSNLPRKQAMGLATDGKSLFVAQPGGFSVFDGATWKHVFGDAKLQGESVSALAATDAHLWIGLQGKGVLRVDRATGKTETMDERHGLTDDWVTQILPMPNGIVFGTFVGGALHSDGTRFSQDRPIADHCVTSIALLATSVLIGTRSGLYLDDNQSVRLVEAKNLGSEIQALVVVGDVVFVGTRNGVTTIRQ